MPGKTKAKRGGVRGIDDGDSQSTTSTRSMYGSDNEDDYNEAPTNKTNSFIDALTEKRSSTREWGLYGLVELIKSSPELEEIETIATELAEHGANAIKKGGAKEAALGAELLAVLFIFLGDNCEEVFQDVEDTLKLYLKNHRTSAVRGKLAEALAMGSFLSGQDEVDVCQVLALLQAEFNDAKATKDALAPALRSWGLLLSSLPDAFVAARVRPWVVVLGPLLEHKELDVRTAATESLAAVYEAAWRHEPEQAKALAKEVLEGEEEEEGGEEEGEEGEAKEGAVRSVKQAKKRERRADNHNTRLALRTLETGAGPPPEKLKVRGITVTIASWRSRLLLQAIKRALQSGLHLHLAASPDLQALLGIAAARSAEPVDPSAAQEEKRFAIFSSAQVLRARAVLTEGVRDQRDRLREKKVNKGRREKGAMLEQEDLVEAC